MLLIVAGARDDDANAAAARLGPHHARLLGATDLSRPGWRLSASDPGSGMLVAGGKLMAVRDVKAVLVRRLAVYPQELRHVHEDDRAYVANEMTALLAWWLHAVPVPVLNRPNGTALCGPGWRPEQWRACANHLGFPVVRMRRETSQLDHLPRATTELTLVGKIIIGSARPSMVECLIALATAAKAVLLYATFDRTGALISAHTFPQLSQALLHAVTKHAGMKMEPRPTTSPLRNELLSGGRV